MADIHEMPDRDGRADLTARQEKVLHVIKDSVDRRGYPPSLREIGAAVQLASPSSVAYQLRMLERKGYLRRDPNRPRAIEVVLPGTGEGEAPGYRRPGPSATADSISTPRFIGPGCMTMQSGLASASFSEVSP